LFAAKVAKNQSSILRNTLAATIQRCTEPSRSAAAGKAHGVFPAFPIIFVHLPQKMGATGGNRSLRSKHVTLILERK
jgi:hypothetical protein